MRGLGEVTAISVTPNAVYHATGKRVRDRPITVEKIFLKGAMAGRRAVAVFRGLSLGIGSGIHPAINGEIRAGNVRGLRTGDERHQGGGVLGSWPTGRRQRARNQGALLLARSRITEANHSNGAVWCTMV